MWGTQRKNTTRKPAQKIQHKLLFFSAAETTTTQNAISQFQVMGRSWKLSVTAFSYKAFLIWCLWNNYPFASELITYISLPTLTICKKYIMQWTKTSPKTQLLQQPRMDNRPQRPPPGHDRSHGDPPSLFPCGGQLSPWWSPVSHVLQPSSSHHPEGGSARATFSQPHGDIRRPLGSSGTSPQSSAAPHDSTGEEPGNATTRRSGWTTRGLLLVPAAGREGPAGAPRWGDGGAGDGVGTTRWRPL